MSDRGLMIIGAILSAFIGFGISELKTYLYLLRQRNNLTKRIEPYLGQYNVKTKSGAESLLLSVKLEHIYSNVLKLHFETKNNGPAEGTVILEPLTLSKGVANYQHSNPDRSHLSGKYDLLFVKPGIIHATLSYFQGKTRKEINEIYIWEIKSNSST